jgi:hypothetical protein
MVSWLHPAAALVALFAYGGEPQVDRARSPRDSKRIPIEGCFKEY